jgi:branched-chain amino acid transport system ATP-binding protein
VGVVRSVVQIVCYRPVPLPARRPLSTLALALDAPLLVLDEPTAQLDPESAVRFAEAVRALRDRGVAVLIVEQNLELLVSLAQRVIVLADGAVLATGAPRDVLGRTSRLSCSVASRSHPHWPRGHDF